jgi:hypothetical protein
MDTGSNHMVNSHSAPNLRKVLKNSPVLTSFKSWDESMEIIPEEDHDCNSECGSQSRRSSIEIFGELKAIMDDRQTECSDLDYLV